ncbi:MAG: hypothetical protein ABJG68_17340 [Crocinitomicaceae bacterium]
MKRVKLIIIIVAVAVLAVMAYQLSQKGNGNSKLSDEALSDFAITDTASVDELILTDTEGNEGVHLKRAEDGSWGMENGACVQQHLVQTMLATFKHIKVKSPVPKGAVENVNKNLTSHHRKVEIYQNGELSKTWYVGQPTKDQYGTYMLLKDPEKGKSPEPFIMYQPNMFGNLESRFITNPLEFECTGVFNYNPSNIKSIEVQLPDSSEYNFKINVLDKNTFALLNNNKEVPDFDTSRVRDYILGFRKVHYEQHNYLTSSEQADSISATTPWYVIEVTDNEGDKNRIHCYKKHMMYEKYDYDGNLIEFDRDRLWVKIRDGRLVVGQFYAFDKVLQDLRFFLPAQPTE